MSDTKLKPRSKRKGAETKAKIIAIAMDLFQRKGFAAVGLNELCAQGDLPKGSLYFHFPNGKNDIAVAVINGAKDAIGNRIVQIGDTSATRQAFVSALVQEFADGLVNSDYAKGCPVATLALEMGAQEPDITAAISQCYGHWQKLVAERLVVFGVADDKAPDLAQFCFCALEGALILARTQKSLQPLEQTKNQLNLILGLEQ
ncbi:TetR/AcrR family transcriptional regulator [Ahrensia marina]|uniref:TetR/AcrR family transcriptional regulator n=1 Tax=Ahrensia marina TaxID=1514904 RepID=UPI0009E936C1|nr:TetR/AcrR family transcriptional regulator [Ahrensia marina]